MEPKESSRASLKTIGEKPVNPEFCNQLTYPLGTKTKKKNILRGREAKRICHQQTTLKEMLKEVLQAIGK